MFDTLESLLQQIKLGEDSCLVFKEVRTQGYKIKGPTQNDLADELAAFANSRLGGVLLMGVSDSGQITGIEQHMISIVEAMIRNACSDSIEPILFVTTRHLSIPDELGEPKYIIRVDISKSLFVHRSPSGYYNRIGDAKKPMPTELLARLFQQRSQARLLPFDEHAVPNTNCSDLNIDAILPFLLEGTLPSEETLLKLKILTKDEHGDSRCSVGGLLLFGRHPQQIFANAVIETRGDGVQIILRESEKLSGKSPTYQLYDDELRLTIYGYPFADL